MDGGESPKNHDRGRSPSGKKHRGNKSPTHSVSPDGRRDKSPSERGRSASPNKFGEKDFERKKLSTESAKKRQNALAKVKGLKLDPSQWTRQELIDKLNSFAHFVVDSKTGAASIFVENRRLLSEDVGVLQEIMRRVTEIQVVNFSGCGLTDVVFLELLEKGLTGLRHLKELRLQTNLLTGTSVEAIVRSFAKTSRKMSVLDLQFNSLGFQDGTQLFAAFHHNIAELNGLPLGKLLGEDARSEVLSLPDRALRLAELGIVCGLMTQMKRLVSVDLARNRINAEGLLLLVRALPDVPYVRNLDLSNNPLTNEGQELQGIQALLALAKQSTQLTRADVEGVLVPGSAEEQALAHSLMANRAVEGHKDGYYFNKFAQALIQRTAKGDATQDTLSEWHGKVSELDLPFIRLNNVPELTVSVLRMDQSGTGRDEIFIRRVPLPSQNIIEF